MRNQLKQFSQLEQVLKHAGVGLVNLIPNGEIWDATPPLALEEPLLPEGLLPPVGFTNTGTNARYGLDDDGYLHVSRGGGGGGDANLRCTFTPEHEAVYRLEMDFAYSYTTPPNVGTIEGDVLIRVDNQSPFLVLGSDVVDIPSTGVVHTMDFTAVYDADIDIYWRGSSSASYTVLKSLKLFKIS